MIAGGVAVVSGIVYLVTRPSTPAAGTTAAMAPGVTPTASTATAAAQAIANQPIQATYSTVADNSNLSLQVGNTLSITMPFPARNGDHWQVTVGPGLQDLAFQPDGTYLIRAMSPGATSVTCTLIAADGNTARTVVQTISVAGGSSSSSTPSSTKPTYTMVASNSNISLRVGDVLQINAPLDAGAGYSWIAYAASPGLNPGDQNNSVQPLGGGNVVGVPALLVAAHPGPANITVNLQENVHGGVAETYTITAAVGA